MFTTSVVKSQIQLLSSWLRGETCPHEKVPKMLIKRSESVRERERNRIDEEGFPI
jgi:hypothetical protein